MILYFLYLFINLDTFFLPYILYGFQTLSLGAQNLCRVGFEKATIQLMLQEMTVIKDRFLSCREKIDKALTASQGLRKPLTELENLYGELQAWHDESEEVIEGNVYPRNFPPI